MFVIDIEHHASGRHFYNLGLKNCLACCISIVWLVAVEWTRTIENVFNFVNFQSFQRKTVSQRAQLL